MNAVAQDTGSIQVTGMGSVVIPADTIRITVRAQSSNNNATQAEIEDNNLLNKTKDALLAAGIAKDEILPGYLSRLTTYHQKVCNTVNNTTTCKHETTHLFIEQMTIKMNRDESKVNKTLEVIKSTGAIGTISGYSLSDTKKIVDEVRKKAMENAQQNAQDYASAYGFTLGTVIKTSESRHPDIEIVRSRLGHVLGKKTLQPGMAYVKTYVRVTYKVL